MESKITAKINHIIRIKSHASMAYNCDHLPFQCEGKEVQGDTIS